MSKRQDAAGASRKIGFPVVLKGCAPDIAHKTEKGLIVTNVRNDAEVLEAFDRIMAAMGPGNGEVLVQEMVDGKRELVAGMIRDPQFGPSVMFCLGGIFTEILRDVSFRIAPLEKRDALEMMEEIKGHKILEAVRGMAPVNREVLADILIQVGRIGLENDAVKEIDINPLIIAGDKPVAVDALIVLVS
ncbi:MAG: acetate--CoA ligase family protein [Pseudomonadota bacterium]